MMVAIVFCMVGSFLVTTVITFVVFTKLLQADGTYPGIFSGYEYLTYIHPMPCLVNHIMLRDLFSG